MARDRLRHQQATSTITMAESLETEVLRMLNLLDADSLTSACEILGLDIPEQNKCNSKLLLKYILRNLNSK